MKYKSILKTFIAVALISISNSIFAQLTPMTLGTIKPGDSIVIYYDVTINSGAGTSVTNQGTITGTGISLVTDDPDTNTPNDATITLLNVFPLPVRLLDVSAVSKLGGIEVSWKVTAEENMISYEVERSNNGSSFSKIGEVAARNNPSKPAYTFTDVAPVSGTNFYRIRMIDALGAKYSIIVRVDRDGKNRELKVYPNPAVNKSITLQMNNMNKGSYDILLYNNLGQMVYKTKLDHIGGSSVKNITFPSQLTKGMYSLKVMNESILLNQLVILQ